MSKFSLRWGQLPTDLRALMSSAGFKLQTITPKTLDALKEIAKSDLANREKVSAARELVCRWDELVKTYEELQRSAERKAEYAIKLNQLKEEYGVDE